MTASLLKISQIVILPLMSAIYILVKKNIDRNTRDIKDLDEKVQNLQYKINAQMTKEDVKEIVSSAVKEITNTFNQDRFALEKRVDEDLHKQSILLTKIDKDIHSLKNSQSGESGVMVEVLRYLKNNNDG